MGRGCRHEWALGKIETELGLIRSSGKSGPFIIETRLGAYIHSLGTSSAGPVMEILVTMGKRLFGTKPDMRYQSSFLGPHPVINGHTSGYNREGVIATLDIATIPWYYLKSKKFDKIEGESVPIRLSKDSMSGLIYGMQYF